MKNPATAWQIGKILIIAIIADINTVLFMNLGPLVMD